MSKFYKSKFGYRTNLTTMKEPGKDTSYLYNNSHKTFAKP